MHQLHTFQAESNALHKNNFGLSFVNSVCRDCSC